MNEKVKETAQEISKKDLLLKTGISYGQLYRWKREGLIPEEWFEKRSAYTGQETFFPRRLVLERVEAIQSMKDGLSLSEIRDMLNAVPRQTDLRQTILETGTMNEAFIDNLKANLEGVWLSELSLKAVGTLYTALDKAGVGVDQQSKLVSQAIEALSVEVPDPIVEEEGEADSLPGEEAEANQVEAPEIESTNDVASVEQTAEAEIIEIEPTEAKTAKTSSTKEKG